MPALTSIPFARASFDYCILGIRRNSRNGRKPQIQDDSPVLFFKRNLPGNSTQVTDSPLAGMPRLSCVSVSFPRSSRPIPHVEESALRRGTRLKGLAAAGHTVEVVAAAGQPCRAPTSSQYSHGFKVHRLPTPGSVFEVHGEASYWLGYAWTVFGYLRDSIVTQPFDVIDFAEYGGEGFYFFLDRNEWTWTPAVVQLHGPLQMFADHMGWPVQGSDFQRVGSMMEDCCIRRADALMACSKNIATFTANRHRIPVDLIDPVFCGVDSEKFRPPRKVKVEPRGRPSFSSEILLRTKAS